MEEMLSQPRAEGDTAPSDAQRDYSGVAVLLPCHNEAVTVQKVVADFQAALPGARIYVFDNNSTDGTGDLADSAGAMVVLPKMEIPGVGYCAMFLDPDRIPVGIFQPL